MAARDSSSKLTKTFGKGSDVVLLLDPLLGATFTTVSKIIDNVPPSIVTTIYESGA